MSFFEFFLFILIVLLVAVPFVRRQLLMYGRLRNIKYLEKQRGSRVITLIHRQESFGLLPIPFFRYIDIEDSEKIVEAVRLTPADMPIDLIVHTPGGLVLAAEQIAHALKAHQAKVTVIVPFYAMSGGTLIALAADEIIIGPHAVLGPIDPIIGWQYSANSIIRAAESRDKDKLDDWTLIMLDTAYRAVGQVKKLAFDLLKDRLGEEKAEKLASLLTSGSWTHDFPLTAEKMKALGLEVSIEVPKGVYRLMRYYPLARGKYPPSVEYIPFPYRKG